MRYPIQLKETIMIKNTKKLALRIENLRRLTSLELSQINGGEADAAPAPASVGPLACNSIKVCPTSL